MLSTAAQFVTRFLAHYFSLSRPPGGFPLWISLGIFKNTEVFNSGKLPHFFCPERNRKVFHRQNDFIPKSPAFPQNTALFAKSKTVFFPQTHSKPQFAGEKIPRSFPQYQRKTLWRMWISLPKCCFLWKQASAAAHGQATTFPASPLPCREMKRGLCALS